MFGLCLNYFIKLCIDFWHARQIGMLTAGIFIFPLVILPFLEQIELALNCPIYEKYHRLSLHAVINYNMSGTMGHHL